MIREKKEVEAFLQQFMPKFDVWGIIIIDRQKNEEALKALGITGTIREEIIRSVTETDYVETITDAFSFGDMWVFGKDYSGQELYIKIAMGRPGSKTICISFHKAEHPITYAFK